MHGSPGFCIHGQWTGKFQILLRVLQTSRTAEGARGPAEATITLSRNCASPPPPNARKIQLVAKVKCIKGARNGRPTLCTQTFFLCLWEGGLVPLRNGLPLIRVLTRLLLHKAGGGGIRRGGVWDPKVCVPKIGPTRLSRWQNLFFPTMGGGPGGGGGWHKALVVGSVSLWRRLLASRP